MTGKFIRRWVINTYHLCLGRSATLNESKLDADAWKRKSSDASQG